MDMFVDDAVNVALNSDGLSSSHPISVPVNDPSEIGEIFDTISYEKVCIQRRATYKTQMLVITALPSAGRTAVELCAVKRSVP